MIQTSIDIACIKTIILAGGFGTRLKGRVPDLPKPMAPISGRPFIEYILDKLILAGLTDIVLSVGYKSDILISHFGHKYRNANISYSIESSPLGTGGAIANAVKSITNQTILVINGDTFLNLDYEQLIKWFDQDESLLAMVLVKMADVSRYGSIKLRDNHVSSFQEKGTIGPGLINAGIYLMNSNIFSIYNLAGRFSLENDLLNYYLQSLNPRAFVSDDYFIDIGVPEDYDRAQYELPNICG